MQYFKIVCYRNFESTPTRVGFYASAESDARVNACFDDTITSFVAMSLGDEISNRQAVRRIYEARYPLWHIDLFRLSQEEFEQQKEVHLVF